MPGREFGILRGLVVVVALQWACGSPAEQPDEVVDAPAAAAPRAVVAGRTSPVTLDLMADLPFAWQDRAFTALDLSDRSEQRRLSRGWYRIATPEQGKPYVWTGGRRSVVELALTDTRDLRLSLRVAPLAAGDRLPQQTLRLTWNGHDLGLYPLEFETQTIEVGVPASLQRVGLNRLELFPLYWVSPASVGLSRNTRPVGVQVFALRIASPELPTPPARPPVAIDESATVQGPGTVVAWHYALPHGARLEGRVRWRGTPPTDDATWTLVLASATGAEQTLVAVPAEDLAGEGRTLDVDLGEHALEMVSIESILAAGEGAGPDDGAGLELVDWRIEGLARHGEVDEAVVRRRYDVLVVLFDTLRADHLAPYAGDAVATPAASALADRGVTFARAVSNASWTRPSIASVLTGLQPSAHRVVQPGSRLSPRAPLASAILEDAGYRTVAVSNNAHFSHAFGFDRGFHEFFEYFTERENVLATLPDPVDQADRVFTRFLEPAFFDGDARPVFAVVHEIDPHAPYAPPAEYAKPYRIDYPNHLDGWSAGDADQGLRLLRAVNDLGAWTDEAERRQMRARYRGEVAFVDAYLGELLARLDATGRRDRTLVVLLSDHGEQFFEHGSWGHGRSLYQEELLVPLVFSLPGVLPEGKRSDVLAQGIDVLPTLLDLLGVPAPPGLQGRSLLPDMFDEDPDEDPRTHFADSNVLVHGRGTPFENAELWHSARYGDWKLMRHTYKRAGETLYEYELYDLARDPGEVFDRYGSERVAGLTLRQQLAAQLARDEARGLAAKVGDEIDAGVLENLRELGYAE